MKSKASAFLKQVFSSVADAVKARAAALRAKASAARTRLLIFGVLRNRKLLTSAISHKIHALMAGHDYKNDGDGGAEKAIVLHGARSLSEASSPRGEEYPDLTHSLFDMEEGWAEAEADAEASVIEMARSAKEGEGGEFRLEDEIDNVADAFIARFHRQIKLQKLDSFKRLREMLQRSA